MRVTSEVPSRTRLRPGSVTGRSHSSRPVATSKPTMARSSGCSRSTIATSSSTPEDAQRAGVALERRPPPFHTGHRVDRNDHTRAVVGRHGPVEQRHHGARTVHVEPGPVGRHETVEFDRPSLRRIDGESSRVGTGERLDDERLDRLERRRPSSERPTPRLDVRRTVETTARIPRQHPPVTANPATRQSAPIDGESRRSRRPRGECRSARHAGRLVLGIGRSMIRSVASGHDAAPSRRTSPTPAEACRRRARRAAWTPPKKRSGCCQARWSGIRRAEAGATSQRRTDPRSRDAHLRRAPAAARPLRRRSTPSTHRRSTTWAIAERMRLEPPDPSAVIVPSALLDHRRTHHRRQARVGRPVREARRVDVVLAEDVVGHEPEPVDQFAVALAVRHGHGTGRALRVDDRHLRRAAAADGERCEVDETPVGVPPGVTCRGDRPGDSDRLGGSPADPACGRRACRRRPAAG